MKDESEADNREEDEHAEPDQIGTAYAARIMEPGMEFAGKTGTSQVRHISDAEREKGVTANEKLPWKERDHALFTGFAPLDAPRYAVAVIVEHGGVMLKRRMSNADYKGFSDRVCHCAKFPAKRSLYCKNPRPGGKASVRP